MFILDSLLIGGLRFVLDKIAQAADAESSDAEAIRQQLLEAEMRRELGELSAAELADLERDLLARLRATSGPHEPLTVGSRGNVAGVDVQIYGERE
jgi:hypothetical protein